MGGQMKFSGPNWFIVLAAFVFFTSGVIGSAQMDARGDRAMNWTIPATAPGEKNPLSLTPEVLEKGKVLYAANCQRCHGRDGRNDGPDSDASAANADLTDTLRVAINPDGVVFYKVWSAASGRGCPASVISSHARTSGRLSPTS